MKNTEEHNEKKPTGQEVEAVVAEPLKIGACGFRRNWSSDSGGKWSAIPVGSGPRFRWEVVQFFDVTGMVDHLPECWTTWTGTVDQITGSGRLEESWRR